ncbi:MAG: hypothetical protein IPM92_08970 [Saprospiraceae bacterium]|nr:hypothetical protein [Saprospiraceae bacterium]
MPNCWRLPIFHGIYPSALHQHLPSALAERLRKGLEIFCQRLPKYKHKDAVLVSTESRTSAPITIPRNPDHLMHPQLAGLYPAGEGAGYAGGILSAAMDGRKLQRLLLQHCNQSWISFFINSWN